MGLLKHSLQSLRSVNSPYFLLLPESCIVGVEGGFLQRPLALVAELRIEFDPKPVDHFAFDAFVASFSSCSRFCQNRLVFTSCAC